MRTLWDVLRLGALTQATTQKKYRDTAKNYADSERSKKELAGFCQALSLCMSGWNMTKTWPEGFIGSTAEHSHLLGVCSPFQRVAFRFCLAWCPRTCCCVGKFLFELGMGALSHNNLYDSYKVWILPIALWAETSPVRELAERTAGVPINLVGPQDES